MNISLQIKEREVRVMSFGGLRYCKENRDKLQQIGRSAAIIAGVLYPLLSADDFTQVNIRKSLREAGFDVPGSLNKDISLLNVSETILQNPNDRRSFKRGSLLQLFHSGAEDIVFPVSGLTIKAKSVLDLENIGQCKEGKKLSLSQTACIVTDLIWESLHDKEPRQIDTETIAADTKTGPEKVDKIRDRLVEFGIIGAEDDGYVRGHGQFVCKLIGSRVKAIQVGDRTFINGERYCLRDSASKEASAARTEAPVQLIQPETNNHKTIIVVVAHGPEEAAAVVRGITD